MSYITYGPSPTSHYRIVRTPADPLLTSPLDRPDGATSLRRRAASASRATLSIAAWGAIMLAAAAVALALRVAVHAAGHSSGLF